MNARPANLHRLGPLLLTLCLASTSAAANTIGCGGDAFSSAEVVPAQKGAKPRPARRGPVTAAPDTLCADLSENRPAGAPNIDVMVGGAQGQPGIGDPGQGSSPSARPLGRGRGR